jgi:transcriptional regulator with XRE-family HTH domain
VSRTGASLRSARKRAGWSRETLADRSGLSGAAVAQIESGRRREVRLSTLVALANALSVSVDYLVGGDAAFSPTLLEHRVLVYDSEDEFLASAAPFVVEGVGVGESVLVVTARRQVELLHDAVGEAATQVEFRDSSEWYRSPGDALNGYRRFVQDRYGRGVPWVRVIGEPVWTGRSEAEVIEWTRYEALINLALATAPATIVCPYDGRSLPDSIVAGARHTHPEVIEGATTGPNPGYEEPEDYLLTVG